MLRLIINPSRIVRAGCKPVLYANAKLFKDKKKRGNTLVKMLSTVQSLDEFKEYKDTNLKLNRHKQCENGKTWLLEEKRLRETIQNSFDSVIK